MKKIFIVLLLYTSFINSQWQPEIQLTNDPGQSNLGENNSRQICAQGDIVHVVWIDNRNGDNEIYYKRSPDKGVSWSNDMRLVYNTGIAKSPSIAATDSILYLAWVDTRFGNEEIMIKRSTGKGISWGNDIRITNNTFSSKTPSLFAQKTLYEYVYIVWEDTRDGNSEIYFNYSIDGGANFHNDYRVSTLNPSSAIFPSISCSGTRYHIAWEDDRDGNHEIYYKHTSNSGLNWSSDTRLTSNSSVSQHPYLIRNDNFIGVIWYDNRDGNNEIYLKTSTNAGSGWAADYRLTNQSDASSSPAMEISGQTIHVAWDDFRNGHMEIYYKRSPDLGLSWSADTRLSNNSSGSLYPSICVSGSAVMLIWNSFAGTPLNPEIFFRKDPTGNPISVKKISSEIPEKLELGQNYPNPFNPVTTIKFKISPGSERIFLTVYNSLGQLISTLIDGQLNPGIYEVEWHADKYPAGIYFYRLWTGNINQTKKMMLIK